ncbi:hypothetical protein ACFQBQ_04875 [Granulicella cerasi]|uniref:Uncharacterized protein n=1 Tax=Granulicella cerasi TaxID=741063 RepID=A0ABW1Z709_9BACT|nr:hypothetical protein [Granulicella cerasi]
MDPQQAQQQMAHAFALLIPMILMFWVVGAAIIIIPFWQIFKKAGMAPALSFLMVLPLVNLVMLYVLAFSHWKIIPAPQFGYQPQQPYPPVPYPPQAYAPPQPPSPYATPHPPATTPTGDPVPQVVTSIPPADDEPTGV